MKPEETRRALTRVIANELGFEAHGPHLIRCASDDVVHVIRPLTSKVRGEPEIGCHVSLWLHSQRFSELVAELSGKPMNAFGSVFGTNLSTLTPSRREYEFDSSFFGPGAAKEVLLDLQRYGLPWLAKFRTVRDLRGGLVNHGIRDTMNQVYACLDYLLDDRSQALQHIVIAQRDLENRTDDFAVEQRQLLGRLSEKLRST